MTTHVQTPPSRAGQVPTVSPAASPRRASRRLLAAAVVGAPLLIAVNSLFHPAVDMTGEGFLSGAVAGPTTWFTVHVVAAIGALVGIPAAFGLRRLVGDRGRRLASWGLALTVVANPVLALGFAAEASVLRLAAGLDPSSALRLAEAFTRTPEFFAIGGSVMLTTLGAILIGLALLVGGRLPRALPPAYLLATVATAAGAPGSLLGPLAFATLAAVSVPFALRILRPTSAAR